MKRRATAPVTVVEDDAYELYVSRGGMMSRDSYRKVVGLVLKLSFLFLYRGNAVVVDDISFVPVERERRPSDANRRYIRLGYVPDISITSSRYAVRLLPGVKQQLLENYENK